MPVESKNICIWSDGYFLFIAVFAWLCGIKANYFKFGLAQHNRTVETLNKPTISLFMQKRILLLVMPLLVLTTAFSNKHFEKTNPMEVPLTTPKLYNSLQSYITEATKEFNQIPADRKDDLEELAQFVQSKVKAGGKARLTFICTHNSRRSHISQIWAQTAAYYYGIEGVETYSGGTEATAFNPRAVKAMSKAGFHIKKTGDEKNPVYVVSFSEEASPIKAFSKVYDAAGNPTKDFAAIMTCSHADQNCPFIPGTSLRLPIPYDDPKEFDNTPREEAKYDERTRQIARELLYAFSLVIKGE